MEICICDDEKELRKSLSKIIKTELQLQGIPCRIREFDSGNALLEGLEEEDGDILFLDIKMKGLNGIDTATQLRKISPHIVIKILYFKSDRKKVTAVTVKGQEVFYARLSDIEAELPTGFIRIHNRYLVNLSHVSRIGNTFCLCGEEQLPVSRACRQKLAAAFARKLLHS